MHTACGPSRFAMHILPFRGAPKGRYFDAAALPPHIRPSAAAVSLPLQSRGTGADGQQQRAARVPFGNAGGPVLSAGIAGSVERAGFYSAANLCISIFLSSWLDTQPNYFSARCFWIIRSLRNAQTRPRAEAAIQVIKIIL